MKNSVFFESSILGPFFKKTIFFLLYFYENPSKVLGYQGWNKILIITLISSQKSPTQNISAASVYLFLRSTNCKKFLMGNVSWLFFKNADVCIPETPPPPRVGKRLQLGTPYPPKNCGRPLWTAPKANCSNEIWLMQNLTNATFLQAQKSH